MDWQEDMRRAFDCIEENLLGEFADKAARLAGCSKWDFYRFFAFITHIPLGEYIRRRKLSRALNDLRMGDEKIIDIALKYGYDSPAAFSRAFHRMFGVSPSSARGDGGGLSPFPPFTLPFNNGGNKTMDKQIGQDNTNRMETYSRRGYYVKENAPVYFTNDIAKTCEWFQNVLGWYGDIVQDERGNTISYSCVFDYPGELIVSGLTPFRGIHIFKGEPVKGVVCFIMVQGLERLRDCVLASGWQKVTEIEPQPWGANECRVTTLDGSILRFFETI